MMRNIKGVVYQDEVGPSSSKALVEAELKRLFPRKTTTITTEKDGWYVGWVKVLAPRYSLVQEMKDRHVAMAAAAADFQDIYGSKARLAGIYAITGLDFWEYSEPVARSAFKKVFEKTTKFKLKVAFISSSVGTIAVAYTGSLNNEVKQYIRDWAE